MILALLLARSQGRSLPVEERFATKQGTILGVQVIPLLTGDPVTTLLITDIVMVASNVTSERNALVTVNVNTDVFTIGLAFSDESLEAQTITGTPKGKEREAAF